MSTVLNAAHAVELLNSVDGSSMGYARFRLGTMGVVLVFEYGTPKSTFQVIADGSVKRAGLWRARPYVAERIVAALEDAGYEMVD